MGFPSETKKDFEKTMNLIDELKKMPSTYISPPRPLEIYPGTEIEENAYQEGVLPRNFSWTRSFNINQAPSFFCSNVSANVGTVYFKNKTFVEECNADDTLVFRLKLQHRKFKLKCILSAITRRMKFYSLPDFKTDIRKTIILIRDCKDRYLLKGK